VSDEELSLLVNGEPRVVSPGCTVEGLVRQLGLERRRIAIAVNRDVVPRSAFGTRELAPGDRIEILEAVGGG
jgi:sulfur carrier protein